jgi:hypothetical protein
METTREHTMTIDLSAIRERLVAARAWANTDPYVETIPANVAEHFDQDMPALLAELEQLRYERRLLGAARWILDLVAEGTPPQWDAIRASAADVAQRIVDEIGHPVTDEPALGPDMRKRIDELTAERDQYLSMLVEIGDSISPTGERPEEAFGTLVSDVCALANDHERLAQ